MRLNILGAITYKTFDASWSVGMRHWYSIEPAEQLQRFCMRACVPAILAGSMLV
jgi:hypothetical protein